MEKKIIIITLTRNPICENKYRNYTVSSYPLVLQELAEKMASFAVELYINVTESRLIFGTPVCTVEHTFDLTDELKAQIETAVKKLSSEGELFSSESGFVLKEESTVALIKYQRLPSDCQIVQLVNEKLCYKNL